MRAWRTAMSRICGNATGLETSDKTSNRSMLIADSSRRAARTASESHHPLGLALFSVVDAAMSASGD